MIAGHAGRGIGPVGLGRAPDVDDRRRLIAEGCPVHALLAEPNAARTSPDSWPPVAGLRAACTGPGSFLAATNAQLSHART
jgi:hypothetical protein